MRETRINTHVDVYAPCTAINVFPMSSVFHNCKCVICSWHTTCRFAWLPDIIRILNALHSVSEFLKASECLAALNQYYKRSRDQDTLNPGIIYSKCMKIRCKIASANPSLLQNKQEWWGQGVGGDSMKCTATWSKTLQTETHAVKCSSMRSPTVASCSCKGAGEEWEGHESMRDLPRRRETWGDLRTPRGGQRRNRQEMWRRGTEGYEGAAWFQ